MNAKSHTLELTVDSRQIKEAVLGMLHTIMLHRCDGKFCYKQEGSYTTGAIGTEDVQCDFMDFTYIRITSNGLKKVIAKHVEDFYADMCRKRKEVLVSTMTIKGTITIEFFQNRRSPWGFFDGSLPWEVWNLVISEKLLITERERQIAQQSIGNRLAEKIFCITEAMNKSDFTPIVPVQSDLDLIYDTTFTDVQPYLFKISHRLGSDLDSNTPPSASVGSTVKRLLSNIYT